MWTRPRCGTAPTWTSIATFIATNAAGYTILNTRWMRRAPAWRCPRGSVHRLTSLRFMELARNAPANSNFAMSTATETIEGLVQKEYKYGFYTDVEADAAPPGLNEDIIRLISSKKNEPDFMLQWRLKAYRHWLTMKEPTWPHVHYGPIDYQKSVYYSAPKKKGDGPKSLDEVDPKLLETYEKLGIPLKERERLAGVAVDAVFDSVSVGTTFKDKLAEKG